MAKKSSEPTPTITKLTDKQSEIFIPTGIDGFDEICGGLPRGRITELWGAESVGKSHLAMKILANLSASHNILYIDTEFSFNKQRALDMGVNLENVDYIADSQLERVCELLVASTGLYDVIILDSLAYLTPLTIDSNEIGETSIGLFARLIKHWIVKFRPRLGVSKTAFVAINQYRAAIGLYIKPEPPGGKSWHHAVDLRLLLTTNQSDRIVKDGKFIGHTINVEVKKNKLSPPHTKHKIKITY